MKRAEKWLVSILLAVSALGATAPATLAYTGDVWSNSNAFKANCLGFNDTYPAQAYSLARSGFLFLGYGQTGGTLGGALGSSFTRSAFLNDVLYDYAVYAHTHGDNYWASSGYPNVDSALLQDPGSGEVQQLSERCDPIEFHQGGHAGYAVQPGDHVHLHARLQPQHHARRLPDQEDEVVATQRVLPRVRLLHLRQLGHPLRERLLELSQGIHEPHADAVPGLHVRAEHRRLCDPELAPVRSLPTGGAIPPTTAFWSCEMKANRSTQLYRSLLAAGVVTLGLLAGSGRLTAATSTGPAPVGPADIDALLAPQHTRTEVEIRPEDRPDVMTRADKARDGFGFPVGITKAARHVHDGLLAMDYDEVSELDSAGQPVSLTQFDEAGLLVTAVRFDSPGAALSPHDSRRCHRVGEARPGADRYGGLRAAHGRRGRGIGRLVRPLGSPAGRLRGSWR